MFSMSTRSQRNPTHIRAINQNFGNDTDQTSGHYTTKSDPKEMLAKRDDIVVKVVRLS